MKKGLPLIAALAATCAAVAATVAFLAATAGATQVTIGMVTCDTAQFNPTHFAISSGQVVHCTISDPNLVVNGTVNVNIQSSSFGNTTVTGVGDTSTHTITFTYTGASNGCNTTAITYDKSADGANGNGVNDTGAGFAFVGSSGSVVVCGQVSVTTSIHDNTSGGDGVTSAQLGDVVHDVATVSGATTGTVNFTFWTNGTCSGAGSSAGSAAVNGSGVADGSSNEGPLAPGDYSFQAAYGTVTSGCEPLHVATPTADNLTGTKDANPSFQRNFTWTIAKSVDKTSQNISGGTATFNYTITVTKSAPSDSGWSVSGSINVSNPNALSVSGVNIADAINDGAASCTVSGGSNATLAPSSITSFSYSCSYSGAPSSQSETNTATITWPDQVIAGFTWLHGSSAPATASVDWSSAAVTVVNDSITVSDSQGGTFGPTSQSTSFTYQKSFPGTPGTCVTYPNTATIDQTGQQSSQSVQVCDGADLTVSKTATPAYTRSYTWGISKSVDQTHANIAAGGQATFKYTVNVTHDIGTDSGWQVSGTIHVANPNDWEAVTANVTDAIDNGGTCAVTGGTGVSIPAGGSVDLPYTCTFSSNPGSGTNTATATWDAAASFTPDGSATGTKAYAFGDPTTIVDGSVSVTDTLGGTLGTVSYTDPSPTTFNYSVSEPGVAGACTNYDNTATFTTNTNGTTGSDSKTVQVCVGSDLVVGKTATPSFTRTFTWGITKSVDQHEIDTAGSATFNYGVTVTHDAGTDSGWQVTGSITVTNPNDWEPVSLTGVTDAIDNGGSCSITSGDPNATIGPNSSVTLGYVCTYSSAPSPASFTNTATASWDAVAASTPTGSDSGTATAAFSEPSSIVNGSVHILDTLGGDLGTVSYTDQSPTTFNYPLTFTDPAGTCTTHTNIATIGTGDTELGRDSQTVKVCVGADLTLSKTVTPSFTRSFTWGITKNVDKTTVTLIGGGTATFNYTVNVTHNSGTDSNFQASGTITIVNPNDWESVTLTGVTDAIDNGGTCSITSGNPNATLAAGGSTTLGYTCSFGANPNSGTNTATATWDKSGANTPDGSASGTANYTFGAPTTIVDGSVIVTDTFGGTLGTVLYTDPSPKTFTYSHGFPAPAAGSCKAYINTATFRANTTGATGSASQTVNVCDFNAPLTPGYWKNHLSQGFALLSSPKLGNFTVGSPSVATAIFNAMNCSSSSAQDAIGCLAGHLLATEFNLANHSDICINAAVTKANAFLSGGVADGVTGINYVGPSGTYSLSSAQRNEAIALKNAFDKYNNGGGC